MQSITYQDFDEKPATRADRVNYWIEVSFLWLAVILAIMLWR